MRITCKNPDCPRKGKPFVPKRAGAQYCTGACRIAAYRLRHKPLPSTSWWDGKEPRFSTAPSRAVNSDGTPALTRGELAERLLEIASGDDDGEPKTGRRFYYLALSYGYIKPDMGDTAEAKDSRDAAYDRITGVLGTLRKMGRLDWDMVLDLTRELDEWQTYGSPREARAALARALRRGPLAGAALLPDLHRRVGHDGARVPADGATLADAVRVLARL
jgi:hypothetical protein